MSEIKGTYLRRSILVTVYMCIFRVGNALIANHIFRVTTQAGGEGCDLWKRIL